MSQVQCACDVPYSKDAFVFAIKKEPPVSDAGCITRFMSSTKRGSSGDRSRLTSAYKKPLNKRKFVFLSK